MTPVTNEVEVQKVSTDIASLDSMSPEMQAIATTGMLDQCRQWLIRAVAAPPPPLEAAEFKAFVSMIAEATKQKKLSEEIRLDADEMVRRSERALGLSIREGQKTGSVRTNGERDVVANQYGAAAFPIAESSKASPGDYFNHHTDISQTYAVTDNVSDEQFDAALSAAKDEGNLSRRNVVRKVQELGTYREQQDEKWESVAELSAQGFTSAQIAREIKMTESGLRESAKRKGIEFPADKLAGTKRINALEVLERIVLGFEVTESSLDLVSYENVTKEQAAEWSNRLEAPLRAIRAMHTELKRISK